MTTEPQRPAVVVLISGGGTNLQALIDASRSGAPYVISAVISNRPNVLGLERASNAGIPTRVLDHTEFPDRGAFDQALGDLLSTLQPRLIVLAGFMRILTPAFVDRFIGQMVNIHPSLLPAFQGLHTHRRALEAGVSEHGASVHFVTAELDGGPVIAQVHVPVLDGDDEQDLAARVLEREHCLLPTVVGWYTEGRLRLESGRVWFDGQVLNAPIACCD